ncbi:adenylyltransferase/sulfurtransferase [Algoriphagus chordae]|uniref:Adenylyltransferase/sulfurtransferase n=2 Tax=Algoriphagus chordae TaxID=237019 RepID=A0A2W7QEF5_9BACT|nr:adenylyltransferase/sulfurtransferase [Algoriphagus chordae]
MILPGIGATGQQKLKSSSVLVVGAGGLGCAVLPYLAAAGIGKIGIIDGDKIEESNLHRQVLYSSEQLGFYKVKEAANSIIKNNPGVEILVFEEFLTAKNAPEIFPEFDLIIDATDNLFIRYVINDTCVACGKPFIYGSIHQFQGQVSVFNYEAGPTYRDVFPEEDKYAPNCAEAGVLGTTVGLIGMLQANEAMKVILGIGEVLSGKLLIYNLLSNEQQVFEFGKVVQKKKPHISNSFEMISPEEALLGESVLLDVRELEEKPVLALSNCIQIPLSVLESRLDEISKEAKINVFCQSGTRAISAAKILQKANFQQVKAVRGGASDVAQLIENEVKSVEKQD